MNLSAYGANAILNGTAMPSTLWVQLHTGDPTTAGTANIATDSRRRSFTRTTATAQEVFNAALIEWLNAPATEDLTHISIWDAEGGGNCWWVGPVIGAPIGAVAGQATEVPLSQLRLALLSWA
jgi:hypothetical protein